LGAGGRATQEFPSPSLHFLGKNEIKIEKGGNIQSINAKIKIIFMCIFYPE
jgi:hypothetical protein